MLMNYARCVTFKLQRMIEIVSLVSLYNKCRKITVKFTETNSNRRIIGRLENNHMNS